MIQQDSDEKKAEWYFCPECGKEECEINSFDPKCGRICRPCEQEWWTDVDYTEVVRQHIAGLREGRAENQEGVIEMWPTMHPYFVTGSRVRQSEVKAWEAGKKFGRENSQAEIARLREALEIVCISSRDVANQLVVSNGVETIINHDWAKDRLFKALSTVDDLLKENKNE